MQRSDGFCRVKQRQNESGVLWGGTFFLDNYLLKVVVITVRTTTFVSRIWNKGYHESVGASILFCEIYCGKAVEVSLISSETARFSCFSTILTVVPDSSLSKSNPKAL